MADLVMCYHRELSSRDGISPRRGLTAAINETRARSQGSSSGVGPSGSEFRTNTAPPEKIESKPIGTIAEAAELVGCTKSYIGGSFAINALTVKSEVDCGY
jgi:hypothetical protein